MSINSVSSTSSIFSAQSVTASVSAATPTDPTTSTSGVSVDISKPGQLLSQLSALAQSDPDQFKSVTASIAQQLKDAASQQGGQAADFLNKLADRFSTASQSGNASDLAPAGGHHHGGGGGHHRMHAAASGSSNDPTSGGGALAQLVQGIISSSLDGTAASPDPSAIGTSAI